MPEFLKVDRPRLLPDLDVRGGLRAGVEGNVDSFPAVEHDGRQVLVEEGLKDDHFVSWLNECRERGVLPSTTKLSACRAKQSSKRAWGGRSEDEGGDACAMGKQHERREGKTYLRSPHW